MLELAMGHPQRAGSVARASAGATPSSNACGERNHSASPHPLLRASPSDSISNGPNSRSTDNISAKWSIGSPSAPNCQSG